MKYRYRETQSSRHACDAVRSSLFGYGTGTVPTTLKAKDKMQNGDCRMQNREFQTYKQNTGFHRGKGPLPSNSYPPPLNANSYSLNPKSCSPNSPYSSLPDSRTARNAFCGISTLPIDFMPLLAFVLLRPQLSFAGDIAAVAFGRDVLAHRTDRFASDDSRCQSRPESRSRTCADRFRCEVFFTIARPRRSASRRSQMIESASTFLPFTKISSRTRSAS